MKTIKDYKLEYRDGYYIYQEYKTSEKGTVYTSESKTFPSLDKAVERLTSFGVDEDDIRKMYQESFLKSCIKKSKPEHLK